MRVLFTANPERSPFQYLVPMAWALRTAGHEVRFAGQPGFAATITGAGLTAVPVGRDQESWRMSAEMAEANATLRAGVPPPYDVVEHPEKLTREYLEPGFERAVTWWHKMDNFPMMSGLVDFARAWRPDLVVWDPLNFAGPVAAAVVGAAHARLTWGLDVFAVGRGHHLRLRDPGAVDPFARWLGGQVGAHGLEFTEELVTGQFTIDQFPASLQIEADLTYLRTRYVPYGGPAVVPRWLWEKPARPRVAFTMGVTSTDLFGGYQLGVQEALDALGELDVEVVATIADSVRDELKRVPDNTRIVPYVPLHALAPTLSAIVHHAGAATMATVALHGVPQLAVPYHFDQPLLGELLTAQGAGLSVHAAEATGPILRESVRRLLEEPRFLAGAERLRAEVAALPSPNELVRTLEELTAAHRR
ncbi:activator-dependent family glycosyltransferase [Actinosynnema sp. NPDC023587]|uniref:activator-dependent family glycosyltransferase n=1 Tax=Actinosynnema sp. NPDC023587 TaxID=3154695 RepID=UPI0033F44410